MADRSEQELILNRFDGTNLLVDAAYLGPSYLRLSINWIPGDTFRIEHRPGSTPYTAGNLPNTTRVHALFATSYAGDHLLFCVSAHSTNGDSIYVSINGGAWNAVASGIFTNDAEVYGFERLNDVVYCANGIDPPKRIHLSDPVTAFNMTAVISFTDGAAAPTFIADSGADILTGTYAYSWCIYDHTGQAYVERAITREITLGIAADQSISFPTPTGFVTNGGVLSSRYRAHLFVAPVNFPVEFAHDQNPEGRSSAGTFVVRQIVADGAPVPLRNATRTGAALRAYLGRLVLGVDQANRNAVWCSQTIAPGLEQALFNTGEYFPSNGRLPRTPTDVTAIGVATVGERGREVSGPLVVTTLSRTFLFSGDIFDDPGASFIQLSARAGCIGANAATETPYGFFYIGTETVWCVPSGGGIPIDVGWPIRPAIQSIPVGSRARCLAVYHKGFLKLSVVPVGSTTAIHGWWLDLRQGIGRVPSWWGPHTQAPVSAMTTSQDDPLEADRGWHALEGSGLIEIIHQPNEWTENAGLTPIVAVMQLGELTTQRPFDRKVWHRVRVIGVVSTETSVDIAAVVDSGAVTEMPALVFQPGAPVIWDATWDATWGEITYVEAESIMPPARPRGRAISLQLTHAQSSGLGIREIELRYETVVRPVRSLPTQQTT